MENKRKIDVATLDFPHRRALEEVIGQELQSNQQVLISVINLQTAVNDDRPAQTLDDWTGIYEGLSDDEIEAVDATIKTRADLTRDIP